MPALPYVYADDVDSTCRRALAARAIPPEAPADMSYGDRRAMVKDACGNVWQVATHPRDLSADETRSRLGDGGSRAVSAPLCRNRQDSRRVRIKAARSRRR